MNEVIEVKGKVVLAVCAHPDDLEFGCGGTIAKWAKAGASIYYLVVTDGSKGLEDNTVTDEELTRTRRSEQDQAAKILGVKKVFFLDYVDGELVNSLEVRKDIVRVIRQVKPEIVFSLDPTNIYNAERGSINHPDHRAVGQATLDAVFPFARNSRTFPELLEEGLGLHYVKIVLLNNFGKATFYVDISDTLDLKLKALCCHKSQTDDDPKITKYMTQRATENGQKIGVEYAEGFVRIDLD